jgi:protein-L-isoaspartate(D-aspartate) O-methyltransferase
MLEVREPLGGARAPEPSEAEHAAARERMVREQLAARDIVDPRVLEAMRRVPRHVFVPRELRGHAYEDGPLPIGAGQTISQPYVVALMTQALALRGGERVLEIGTGCGYQTAVLAELAREVGSVEIVDELLGRARGALAALGARNVHLRAGDGRRGWPEASPFDAILAAAAPEAVPEPLLDQLALGGRLVIPIGGDVQELVLIRRDADGLLRRRLILVRFVPMTGGAGARSAGSQSAGGPT